MQWVCVRGWWMSGAGIARRGCCCVCRLHIVSPRALIHILRAEAVKDPFKMLRAWFTIRLSNFFYVNFFLFYFFILLTYTATVSSRRSTKPVEDWVRVSRSTWNDSCWPVSHWPGGTLQLHTPNLTVYKHSYQFEVVAVSFHALFLTDLHWAMTAPNVAVIKWLIQLCSASS